MKQKLTYFYSLLLTALFLLPWTGVKADPSTLTLYGSETTTNSYIPVNGEYIDTGSQLCQFIYPEADIKALKGQKITALKFYTYWYSNVSFGPTFTIKIMEVAKNTYFPSSSPTAKSVTDATTVYTGTLSVNASKEMDITLSAEFECAGDKDLLIQFSAPKGSTAKTCMFYGKSASGQGYYEKTSKSTTKAKQDFLPRVTFTYEAASSGGGEEPSCAVPTDLAVPAAYITTNGAKITWDKGEATSSTLEYKLHSAGDEAWAAVSTGNTTGEYTFTSGLTANTQYDVRVKNVCSESESDYTIIVSFTTECEAKSIPFTCGFESSEGCSTGTLPACWKKNSTTSSPAVTANTEYTTYAKTGTQAIRFNSNNEQYLILPQFSQEVKNLQISFWYKNYMPNWYSSNLSVGSMTDPTDKTTFTEIKALSQVSDYTQVAEQSLATAPAGDYYIAFKYTATSTSAGVYLDDINVEVIPNCQKPADLVASAASSSSINLSWTAKGEETAWQVQYRIGSGSWSSPVAASTNPFTLTGLEAQTTYEIQVRANCGDGDGNKSAWSASATEATDCAAKSIPWDCGFEIAEGYTPGSTTGPAPECWKMIGVNQGAYPYAYVNNSSSYVKSGTYSLYVISSGSKDAYLIFPKMDAALNTLQVSFYHKSENTSKSAILTLGYITNPADASTFVAIGDAFTRSTTWSHEEGISLASVPANVANTAYIAFKLGKATDYYYTGIDDIEISVLPSCAKPSISTSNLIYNGATVTWAEGSSENKWKLQYSTNQETWTNANNGNLIAAASFNLIGLNPGTTYYLRAQAECEGDWSNTINFTPTCVTPSGLQVESKTTTTATIRWTVNSGETEWNVQYKESSAADWTTIAGVTENPYTIEGLTAGTDYRVRVAATCNNYYAAPIDFPTECETISSFPWSEDFENKTASKVANCWDISASAATTTKTNNPEYIWGVYSYSGNKMMRMYNYYVKDGAAIIYSPSITLPAGTAQELTFDYSNLANCGAFKVKVTKDEGANWAEVGSYANPGTSYDYTNPGTFSQATIDLTDYKGETIILQFYALANYSSGAIFVDNLSIHEKPACAAPTAVVGSNATNATAQISWTNGGEEAAWRLQYTTVNPASATDGDWTDANSGNDITTKPYTLTGLDANTTYYARVKANCGGSMSLWSSASPAFQTDCDPVNMLSKQEFSSSLPECWKLAKTGGYDWAPSSTYKVSASYSMYYYGYTATENYSDLITPSVTLTEDANLKFQLRNYYYGSEAAGEVYIVTSSATTKLLDFPATTYAEPWALQTIDLSEYTGQTVKFIFRGHGKNSGAGFYIDDVEVSAKPCDAPTAVNVAASSSDATITWTDATNDKWNLRWREVTEPESAWTLVEDLTAKTLTLTKAANGLEVGKTYQVQVQTECSDTKQSDWTAVQTFELVCNAPSALTVTARTQNSATFSWTSSESAWVLQYSVDGENWESENVTANPFTLEGLAAGQTYQAKIQSACGSAFTDAVSFTTWCGVKDASELPINITSFSAVPECWEATFKSEYSGVAGSKICFYGTEEQWLVLPAYDINLNQLSVTFTFTKSGATPEFGYIDEPNGTFHAFSSAVTSGVELNLENEAAAVKYIAVRYPGGSGEYSNVMITAVNVRRTPGCAKLNAPTATPGVGSAEISWTAGSETAWNLQYKLASAADWTTIAVTEKPYTLNGLEQGVSYKVRVQANCGGEDGVSDWSDETTFTTNCDAIDALPYNADFSQALSSCWTVYAEDETYYKPAVNTFSQDLQISGGKSGASDNIVAMPAISADLTNAVLSFEYRGSTGSNYAQLEVGYLTDKTDASTFQSLQTLEQAGSYTEARVAVNGLENKYLAFKYAGGSSQGDQYIKNLRVINAYNLADDEDNSATLAALNGQTVDVTIGRTFVCADYYNTICLPFSLSAEELAASPIASDDLWAFKYARVEGGELLIRIVETDHINAGEPYLIAWSAGENIVNPLFKNVTISASAGKTMGEENLKFVGTLKPETFAAHDNSKLFLYSNNTLYWWDGDAESHMNSFRAFFTVEGGVDDNTSIKHLPARIVKHDNSATGCETINADGKAIKLLENNQVVIIRNGVKYTIQGQKIQ